MSELILVDKLQPENINEGFCTQHCINQNSADDCKQQLQVFSSRQEGEFLQHIDLCLVSVLNFNISILDNIKSMNVITPIESTLGQDVRSVIWHINTLTG